MKNNNLTPHVGKVIKIDLNSRNKHTGYYINEGDDEYFVHLGDLKENEEKLYRLYDEGKLTTLEEGDTVEFTPFGKKHAIKAK